MEAIERTFLSNDWITLIFLFGIMLLFFMKMYNSKRLFGYSIAFFTQGFIQKRAEEDPSFFSLFHGLLFLFSTTTIALTLYFIASESIIEPSFISFLIVFGCIILYLLIHFFISYSVYTILGINEDIRYFLYTKSGYLYASTLWIFPILILYTYGVKNSYFLLIFIAIIATFRIFLILINNKKLIFNQLFYFILYFCSLELAPLLIIYKTTTI